MHKLRMYRQIAIALSLSLSFVFSFFLLFFCNRIASTTQSNEQLFLQYFYQSDKYLDDFISFGHTAFFSPPSSPHTGLFLTLIIWHFGLVGFVVVAFFFLLRMHSFWSIHNTTFLMLIVFIVNVNTILFLSPNIIYSAKINKCIIKILQKK